MENIIIQLQSEINTMGTNSIQNNAKFVYLADRLTRALIGEKDYGVRQLQETIQEYDFDIKAYSAQVPTEYNKVFRDLANDIAQVLQKHLE
jgi:hypothetical protein